METKRLFKIILNCLIITLFIGAGITILILRSIADSYTHILLGTILIIAGGSRAAIYYINSGYKYTRNISNITSFLMICLGVVFLIGNRDIEMLCFGWGVMEIAIGLIEVYIDILEVKETKIAWLEMIVNIGTIIFGVLLCLKLSDGLTGHIIFLGISLIFLGIIAIVKFISFLSGKE